MKKKEATTTVIVPTTGTITSDITLGLEKPDDIIEAEVIEEDWGDNHPNFIESNTQAITLDELQTKNVIPTFVDGTLTLSHQNFIGAVRSVAEKVFGELTPVECRVSHPIIGRIPSAQHKKASELTDADKTIFYQRLAFCCHVKNLTKTINGQSVHLCIGGVRAYNEDKLYNRPTALKFKIFVGWQVTIGETTFTCREETIDATPQPSAVNHRDAVQRCRAEVHRPLQRPSAPFGEHYARHAEFLSAHLRRSARELRSASRTEISARHRVGPQPQRRVTRRRHRPLAVYAQDRQAVRT